MIFSKASILKLEVLFITNLNRFKLISKIKSDSNLVSANPQPATRNPKPITRNPSSNPKSVPLQPYDNNDRKRTQFP